jgi:hypothetical protein
VEEPNLNTRTKNFIWTKDKTPSYKEYLTMWETQNANIETSMIPDPSFTIMTDATNSVYLYTRKGIPKLDWLENLNILAFFATFHTVIQMMEIAENLAISARYSTYKLNAD